MKKLMIVFFVLLLLMLMTACAGPKGSDGQTGEPGLIGLPGMPGKNYEPDFMVVGYKAPCAAEPNNMSAPEVADYRYEVFMVESRGALYGVISNDFEGRFTRLGRVTPNVRFRSTGAITCDFYVTEAGEIVRL